MGTKDQSNKKDGLQKISEMLKSMGISEDCSKEFVSICEEWRNNEKNRLQEEYKARLERAKKACIEETEAHKVSLSRGLQVFLENEAEKIRKASEKQAAIAEPEAVNRLKQIQSILGGSNIDGAVNAQALQAESKKNALLVKQVAELTESLSREKAKSSKFHELTEKAINRQKGLEKEITETKNLLSEAKGRLQKKNAIFESKVKADKPKTRRKVVSESDNKKKKNDDFDSEIDYIASSLD
jgi:hypothetical protein